MFLNKLSEQWFNDKGYQDVKEIVNDMSVINDVAERGVKMCSNLTTSSRNKDMFRDNIKVVVENKKNVQIFRKIKSFRT